MSAIACLQQLKLARPSYFAKLLPFMRLDIAIACFLAVLLVCPASLESAQISKNNEAGNINPSAPLKVGGDVSSPRVIYGPDPELSEKARSAGFEGSCVLRLIVGTDGKPYDISEVRTAGMGLDENAIEAVRRWVFEPARRAWKPVAVQIDVEISFRLNVDATEIVSPEQSEKMSEDRARVHGWVYKDPEGHNPRACRRESSSAGEQRSGPVVTIAEVSFEGNLLMTGADQAQISALIRQQPYSGDGAEVISQALEKAKAAWQEHGYSNVQVRGDSKILSSSPANEQVALTVQVDEGPQYRLERITFNGNRVVTNVEALRSLFPIKNGSVFDLTSIRDGVDNLRKAYLDLGHLNFTSIPNTTIDERSQTASLDIDIYEGKKFFVSHIDIMGLDEASFQNALKDLLVKPGDVYDQRGVDLFLQEHASLLPIAAPPDSLIILQLDEREGTVAITYDFRPCRVE